MSYLMPDRREPNERDFKRMGIGKRYWGVELAKIPGDAEYRGKLQKYIGKLKAAIESGFGLYLYGPFRSGKTSAAVIAMKEVVAHGGSAFFIRADEVAGVIIERTMFDDEETISDRMRRVDLLAIDDLGAETTREIGAGIIERLIRWRYDDKKSLIVTTNVERERGDKKMNEGTLKVLRSMTEAVRVDGTRWFEGETDQKREFFEGE